MTRHEKGFTMVELIVILAVIGILAAISIPRLSISGAVNIQSAAEILMADIRYAQGCAFRKGMTETFTIASNGYTITDGGGTNKSVTFGSGDYASVSGVSLTGNSFTFDRKGTPSVGQNITVSGNGSAVTVAVTAETGRVGIQ